MCCRIEQLSLQFHGYFQLLLLSLAVQHLPCVGIPLAISSLNGDKRFNMAGTVVSIVNQSNEVFHHRRFACTGAMNVSEMTELITSRRREPSFLFDLDGS